MEIIAHRINTLEGLEKLPNDVGAEIDVRCHDFLGLKKTYLHHEPYEESSVVLEDFLKKWKEKNQKGTLILDIKNERCEHECKCLLDLYKIKKYFFLDCSFPMIYKLTSEGEHKVAVRFSEFEGMDTVINMAGDCKWVWVDTFTKNPLTKKLADEMHWLGYKICFVSPELQGQPEKKEEYLEEVKDYVDAICTDL